MIVPRPGGKGGWSHQIGSRFLVDMWSGCRSLPRLNGRIQVGNFRLICGQDVVLCQGLRIGRIQVGTEN